MWDVSESLHTSEEGSVLGTWKTEGLCRCQLRNSTP